MNMFARFDENPAMTLQVIKETKRYGRTDGRTDGHTDGRTDNVKTVYPLQTKFAGGIITHYYLEAWQIPTCLGCGLNEGVFCGLIFLRFLLIPSIVTNKNIRQFGAIYEKKNEWKMV